MLYNYKSQIVLQTIKSINNCKIIAITADKITNTPISFINIFITL